MNETALITGATSGIGLELAKLFARDKINLILVARHPEKLHEVQEELQREYGVQVTVIASDLSLHGAATWLHADVKAKKIEVNYLVNNAGFGLYGKFHGIELEDELAMLELNCAALTTLTKLFSREMIHRGRGRILNVASTAAFQPGPLMAVYYASKAYVLSLSEALRNEFAGTGVTVSCLCPGPTPTGFQDRAGNQKSGLLALALTSAEQVARTGYRGMRRGKSVIVPGLINKLLVFSVRFAPRNLATAISRWTAESR